MKLAEGFRVYRWAISFLWVYRTRLVLFISASLFVSLVQMASPMVFQQLIDVYIPNRDLRAFFFAMAGLVILFVIMIAVMQMQNRMQRQLQEYTARDVQLVLFEHLRNLGFPYYEKHPTGETLGLFQTDVVAMQQLYKKYFPEIIKTSIILLVTIILMLQISWELCLYTIPSFLLYYVIGPYAARKSAQYGREGTEKRTRFTKKVHDTVSSLLELRTYSAQAWDSERFQSDQSSMYSSILKHFSFNYVQGSTRGFTVNLGSVLLFLFGSILLSKNEVTIGTFIAFTFYYYMVMGVLAQVINLLMQQRMVIFQTERVYHFMQEKPLVTDALHPVRLKHVAGALALKNIRFGYSSERSILQGFHLRISPGEHVAILGSSGCGKSTLLKLLARFYDPDHGEIELDGVHIRQIALQDLRNCFGVVFQESFLFDMSIRDNIKFGAPEASDAEVEEAARAAYAHAFIMELPEGYDTVVGERGVKLSGGQKQRIAIARLFLKKPAILLLDEATSALDNQSEREVKQALDRLLHGRTTITVAHRITTVLHYDRLVFLQNGAVAEQGTYEELMRRRGMFHTFVEGEALARA